MAAATPTPTPLPTAMIFDEAELLSDAQKAELSKLLGSLELRTKRQVVIATVKSLGGKSIDDQVEALGSRLGVHDGVVLMVAPKERQVRLAVGQSASKLLTNAESGRIVNQTMYPDLHANRFGDGILKGVDAIVAQLSETTA